MGYAVLRLRNNEVTSVKIENGSILNEDINAAAAIAKTKLANLDIVNTDINASAAIAKTKLANLDIVNADINASAAIAKTKLANLDIVNTDINALAAIAGTKLSSEWQKDVANGILGLDVSGIAPHIITKSASANIRNSHDAEAYTAWNASYLKLKTITLSKGLKGTARFLFDLRSTEAGNIAYGKIYRNGVALGTEQTNNTISYITKSEDITQIWLPGDTCELWVKAPMSFFVYVRNFRIAYDDSPTVAVSSVNS